MFLLDEYSRNILHHVRPQTVASPVPGQTKLASMNESQKPTPLIRMNAVLNSSCMVINYGPLEEGGQYSLNLLNDDAISFVMFNGFVIFYICNKLLCFNPRTCDKIIREK